MSHVYIFFLSFRSKFDYRINELILKSTVSRIFCKILHIFLNVIESICPSKCLSGKRNLYQTSDEN